MDKRSFELTILPQYRRVFAVCLSVLGDREEAADAVQETFSILWERREELDSVVNKEGYCRAVAKNICLKRIRQTSIHDPIEAAHGEQAEDNSIEVRSELGLLRQLLEQLPPSQKRVMILSSFGSLSTKEIAEATGESEDNVRQLLSRARKRMKELYKDTAK